ncbi:MAG: putative 4-hydroxybenzoate polyprenyltransferase [Aquificaceae bacterium]|nr:putative 4-hydroxybenzoate polyprenyltransferase [Aquificaceae bacterium]MDW8237383.1 4-hydroxybenzoate octaprenyltransferase [Aquificaceae bacterium]
MLRSFAKLTKIEHTIFALPFLISSIALLYGSFPDKTLMLTLAFLSARLTGMALNRLIDLEIDKLNPRMRAEVHVKGELSKSQIEGFTSFTISLFIFSCAFINLYTLFLAWVVLIALWVYPYAKRYTNYPHFVLGFIYFLVPIAVEVSLKEGVSIGGIVLGIAMASFVSGFDILYALLDRDFDIKFKIGSIPAKHGVRSALIISSYLHIITFVSLFSLVFILDNLGIVYSIGVFIFCSKLIYKQLIFKV